jgi:predicted transcriptional regulator of viral defense system
MIDSIFIKEIIEKDFQKVINNVVFENENYLKDKLVKFLKLNLPANINVKSEEITKFGVLDILVNNEFIIELKYADNVGTLERGISEIIRYRNFDKEIIVIILDTGKLSKDIFNKYSEYFKQAGAKVVIIIKAKGKRKRVDTNISFLEKYIIGKHFIIVEEILKNFKGNKDSLKIALYRLEQKGEIERIEKGKYLIIPLGAEKGKYTLHEFVIGSTLIEPYSIAYWSALNYYGLTEQIPNTVFMQTTARKKSQNIRVFGVEYKIVKIKEPKFFGIRKEWIEETQINITDKEKTIIDCLDLPQYAGGIIEVAKALKNNTFDNKKLSSYAQRIGNSGVIRRLGYLCEFLNIKIKLPKLDTRNYLLLDPTMPEEGPKSAKWRLIINLDEKILGEVE